MKQAECADTLYDADDEGHQTHLSGKTFRFPFFTQLIDKGIGKLQRIEFSFSGHVDHSGHNGKDT